MAAHGKLSEFDPQREDWISYSERLQAYFEANDIESADKKKAIFLSVVGAGTYQLIRSLVAPQLPSAKNFDDLVKVVQEHYQPTPSVIVQRFKFNSRMQKPGKSIATFIAELRKLAEHCKFQNTLEDMLRDRLVCGVTDGRLQRRLLAEPDLTLKDATKIALAQETAEKGAQQLQQQQGVQSSNVHKVGQMKPHRQFQLPRTTNQYVCHRCGGNNHKPQDCRFKDAECRSCKKKGHIARVCHTAAQQRAPGQIRKPGQQSQRSRTTHHMATEEDVSDTSDSYELFTLQAGSSQNKPLLVTVKANNSDLEMEIDTGASLSIISEVAYNSLWAADSKPPLKATNVKLHTYTKESLQVLGLIEIEVVYKEQKRNLPLLIVAGNGPNLMGRNWLMELKLEWQELYLIHQSHNLQTILDRHRLIFNSELGEAKGVTAKLHINDNTKPYFCRARPVPHALKGKVEQELEHLKQQRVIEPVQMSEWAAPIVPVLKPDGTIRICGDYKMTINRAAKPDVYPLPRVEDLFATLAGGKAFTKLDLAQAYQQIPLEESSKQYVTINTHKGLFRYNRLPFGVSAAPSIFQRIMENLLQGIPHVSIYLDDILITGTTETEHLNTLDEVLSRLVTAGFKLKQKKCGFLLSSVEYLGHKISAKGLQPTEEKVRAIKEAPPPSNVSQLRSFIGLVNYYGKFLPNLANTLAPLYSLLQKDKKWSWGDKQQAAFVKAKEQLSSDKLLVHFDTNKELLLSVDASPYGIGAVLSHQMPDGTEQPIAFASRSLSKAELKYAHLDKEGLAIVFGVKKFHQYLFGRKFTIYSDHKPLQHIFAESRPIPSLASARIQRWALTLSAYNYQIKYKPGKDNSNADVFSRLPLPESPVTVPLPGETVFLMDTLENTPVNATQIKNWTNNDRVLAKVREMVQKGWNHTDEESIQPYQRRKDELSVHAGCVMLGNRVVIPLAGRKHIIEQLHQSHPGITRMKGLARSFVWWPGMDSELESKVKSCQSCQLQQDNPAKAPLHPWEWSQRAWSRIHIDYAGPIQGKMILITTDAYSKWIDAQIVNTATSGVTIEHLRTLFATHGIPEVLVSDNGTQFTSTEFEVFMRKNGICHVRVSPYHPSSNGLAERAVKTVKEGLKKCGSTESLQCSISRILFHYRITPHSTTGVSPAELLFGRQIRSHLDQVKPNLSNQVILKQASQKKYHDYGTRTRSFQVGDTVFVQNQTNGPKWLAGQIQEIRGPVSYSVTLQDGRVMKRHVDQIRSRTVQIDKQSEDMLDEFYPLSVRPQQPTTTKPDNTPSGTPPLRRSTRIRNPPDRYMPENF